MALNDGYLYHVVAAIGIEAQIPTNFVQGEIGYVSDRIELIVGDGSPVPARVVTDKTIGNYSLATLTNLTLPSGLVVNQAKVGSVGPITPSRMVAGLGLLAYRGQDNNAQDTWGNVAFTSSDTTLIITNPTGTVGNSIDHRINPNSSVLINLINSLIAPAIAALTPATTTTPTPTTSALVGTFNTYTAPAVQTGNATQTALPFAGNTNSFGTWSNGTFTFSVAGSYSIKAWVPGYLAFPLNEGFYAIAQIFINNTAIDASQDGGYGAYGANVNLTVAATFSANVGDQIQVTLTCGGAPYGISSQSNTSRMTIKKEA